MLFCQITKNTQQQLHHIFFKTETVQDFFLDLFKVPWQIFLSLIDNDLISLDLQNHSHFFCFFCFCFPTLYFSVGVVQRDISIGFSDTLVIVTVQIAPACSILHQHCLPNTIYFQLMKYFILFLPSTTFVFKIENCCHLEGDFDQISFMCH